MTSTEQHIIDLNARAEGIVAGARLAGRELTTTETAEIDFILADAALADEHRPLGRISEPDSLAARQEWPQTRYTDAAEILPRSITGKKRALDVFGAAPRDTSGFRDIGAFMTAVARGGHHPGLQTVSADWREGVGESGGFMVPPQFAFNLLDGVLERSIVLSNSEVYTMIAMYLMGHGSIIRITGGRVA